MLIMRYAKGAEGHSYVPEKDEVKSDTFLKPPQPILITTLSTQTENESYRNVCLVET
jgi:hypothetical protein